VRCSHRIRRRINGRWVPGGGNAVRPVNRSDFEGENPMSAAGMACSGVRGLSRQEGTQTLKAEPRAAWNPARIRDPQASHVLKGRGSPREVPDHIVIRPRQLWQDSEGRRNFLRSSIHVSECSPWRRKPARLRKRPTA